MGGAGAVVAGGGVGQAAGGSAEADRRDPRASRTGAPWRDLPREYGPWQTVYGLFRRWQRDGTWPMLLTSLQTRAHATGLITWEVNVDSTICRAHQHAAGARRNGGSQKEPPGGIGEEPDDHGLGRSRGGFTTKIHLACEQGQRPLLLLVTAGQRGDSPQFTAVLEGIRVPRTGPGRPRVRQWRATPASTRWARSGRRTGSATPARLPPGAPPARSGSGAQASAWT
ncbi:IS5 family transposase [Streptomyces sp. NPDC055722]